MREITTSKQLDDAGNTYAKAAGCPGTCYRTTIEGQVLEVCHQYQLDPKRKQECCDDECEA